MTTIIRDIQTDLERTRENMLALSDDIWLSIDHNDSIFTFKRLCGYRMEADPINRTSTL